MTTMTGGGGGEGGVGRLFRVTRAAQGDAAGRPTDDPNVGVDGDRHGAQVLEQVTWKGRGAVRHSGGDARSV